MRASVESVTALHAAVEGEDNGDYLSRQHTFSGWEMVELFGWIALKRVTKE